MCPEEQSAEHPVGSTAQEMAEKQESEMASRSKSQHGRWSAVEFGVYYVVSAIASCC